MKWEILAKLDAKKKTIQDIVYALLKNREIVSQKEENFFFKPPHPNDLSLGDLEISKKELDKTLKRLKKALKDKDQIVIFGDYDADGISSTAILWETLYALSFKVSPFIPDRFSDGYGLKKEQIEKIIADNPNLKLIITVDNGIVANDAVDFANSQGLEVIISDHHLPSKKLPNAYATIQTTKTSGAGISWMLSREILKEFADDWQEKSQKTLDLCALGVIADQMPLVGVNRSFVKHGLEALRNTTRVGLKCVFDSSSINSKDVSTYHVNYLIAPRINAMGRLKHGMDSLRLICTKDALRAQELALLVSQTNEDRQKIVNDILVQVKNKSSKISESKVIVLADENYHEGVIGLIAARLVEIYYRPVVVFSKGEVFSKASARSVTGFNIIEVLRSISDAWVEGGGHSMAAGFTVETARLEEFTTRICEVSQPLLTDEILLRKIKIDLEIDFPHLSWDLAEKLADFEPFGLGNLAPVFVCFGVEVLEVRVIGSSSKHLKLKLKKDKVLEAIFFGGGEKFGDLEVGSKIDIVFNLEVNQWNGNKSLQLKIKDLKKDGD